MVRWRRRSRSGSASSPEPASWTHRHTRSRKRLCPSMPRSFHSPPSRYGPRNIRWRRRVSAPCRAMYSSGLTTLPLLFDILPLPPKVSMPLARKRVNGSGAVPGGVDDGEGRSPVARARDDPVAQPELHVGTPGSAGLEQLHHPPLALQRRSAVELAGVDHRPVAGPRLHRDVTATDHLDDAQVVSAGKLPVPLVVPRHRHDRPGAVAAEHVGGGPDRDLLAGEWMHGDRAEVDAHGEVRLGVGRGQRRAPLLHGGTAVLPDEVGELRMIRADHQEGGAEEGVGAGGEHRHLGTGAAIQPEVDESALAAPDPIALRDLCPLAPVEVVESVEHLLRIAGGLDEPLLEEAGLDHGAAALAGAAHDLLVGEDGEARRAPVDRALAVLGEPRLEELEKHPLGPAVVVGAGGVDLVGPVDAQPDPFELASEVLDIASGQGGGMLADLERVVLRVDAEGVEAEWLEDVIPLLAAVAAVDVRPGECVGVADVQLLRRWVGEHHQAVEGSWPAHVGAVGLALRPAPLPLGVQYRQVETVETEAGGGGDLALHGGHRLPRHGRGNGRARECPPAVLGHDRAALSGVLLA